MTDLQSSSLRALLLPWKISTRRDSLHRHFLGSAHEDRTSTGMSSSDELYLMSVRFIYASGHDVLSPSSRTWIIDLGFRRDLKRTGFASGNCISEVFVCPSLYWCISVAKEALARSKGIEGLNRPVPPQIIREHLGTCKTGRKPSCPVLTGEHQQRETKPLGGLVAMCLENVTP
ncbi:hypothetical protein MLD38_005704 [Melastoma candidum]|uniref:Uncharacterized protein n=1 Tax=Melastoma candidum TaxID=119954 RepID=A0ACB9RL34_9MYRT|nr:hypothetical protein MLD38_005704 [Melastoma candidum]